MRWISEDRQKLQNAERKFNDLRIYASNYNEYLSELKEDALYKISKVFKAVMHNKIQNVDPKIRNIIKYHMNNMLPKEVIMADPKDIPGLMHQLPMTQIYDPNINPLHANVIQLDGAKFLYINIDGQSQTMIGPNSPILDHMLRQHLSLIHI